MIKFILGTASLIFFWNCLYAQQVFQFATGGSGSDAGRCIVKTTDGGYVIAGATYSFGKDSGDAYILKLSSSGVVQWSKTIGEVSYDVASDIIQTSDGGYAFTGRTGYWTFKMYIVKLDSAGNLQWTKKINNGFSDQGYSLIQVSDGGYVVSGRTSDASISSTGWLIKLNGSGVVQWSRFVQGFADGIYSVVQTPGNGFVLAGITTLYGAGGSDLYVVKVDSAGTMQWTRTVGGTGMEMVTPGTKISKTSDGGFVMAGSTSSFGSGGTDLFAIKLNSSGGLQWSRAIGGTGDEMGHSVVQTSNKGYIMSGSTTSFGAGNYDAYMVLLDSTGTLVWTRTTGGGASEAGYSIVETNSGGFMMTGVTSSHGSGNSDVYLVRLDAAGNTCNNSGSGGISVAGGSAGSGGGLTGNITWTASTGGISGSGAFTSNICSCSLTASITASGPLTFCTGGSVTFQAVTGPGLLYQWKKNGTAIPGATAPSYTATATGTYKVSVSSAGCATKTSSGKTVTVNSLPAVSATAQGPLIFCAGDSVLLKTNLNSLYSYQWKKNNTNIQGANKYKYYAKTAGNYKVRVTNNNTGCTKMSGVLTVTVPCRVDGDKDSGDELNVVVYPNPSSGSFTFRVSQPDMENSIITIYDMTGRALRNFIINGEEEVMLEDLDPAVYVAHIRSGSHSKSIRLTKTW